MGDYSSSCSSLFLSQSPQPPCSLSTLRGASVLTLEKWLTCAQQEVLWLTRWLLLLQHVLSKLNQQEGHFLEGEEKAKVKEKAREKGKNAQQWMKSSRILRRSLEMMPVYTMLWDGLMKKEMLTMKPSPWM